MWFRQHCRCGSSELSSVRFLGAIYDAYTCMCVSNAGVCDGLRGLRGSGPSCMSLLSTHLKNAEFAITEGAPGSGMEDLEDPRLGSSRVPHGDVCQTHFSLYACMS